MNKIIKKIQYSEKVYRFDVEAPLIAKSRKAGNFVIIRVDANSERMPLTIADADIEKGTITLVVQKVGLSSTKLCNLNEGDEIHDVVGPLGNPTHIENYGTVICAGGGVGVAPMLPIMRALKAAGNRVLSVIAGRNKELVIMEDEVRASSDELIIMTDDGSYGEKGVVTVGIEKLINQEHIDKVFAIGPPIMMKFCCLLTQKYNIPTDVSLNTIMVDGTGMILVLQNEAVHFQKSLEGYLSLFSLGREAKGVSIQGMKYNLKDYTMSNDFPIGISNEFTAPEAELCCQSGHGLVILTRADG